MSQQQTPLFGGSNSATSTRKPLYTGLNVFKVLTINPSKEEIEQMIGRPYSLKIDYSIQDIKGKRFRPIEIWVGSIDGYVKAEPMRFLIGEEDDINKNGTYRYVNALGEFCQSKTDPKDNPKMSWFTAHPYRIAKIGEYELYRFMQTLMRYSSRDDNAVFMKDAQSLGITPERLYDGDMNGLNQFFKWSQDNDNKIVLLCAVRRSEKIDENGQVKHYDNQVVVTNPNHFYRTSTNEVNNRSFKSITEDLEKGSRITNSMFTIYFQEFKEEDCLNKVPTETVSSDQPTTFGNWLNK